MCIVARCLLYSYYNIIYIQAENTDSAKNDFAMETIIMLATVTL